jgi:hypothetical protein
MTMSHIEIRLSDGLVLIGPPSLVPPNRRGQFRGADAIRLLFVRSDAVSRLRAEWPRIPTPGDNSQHIIPADLRRALEAAVATHRIVLIWLPHERDVKVAPPAAHSGTGAAPTPKIPFPTGGNVVAPPKVPTAPDPGKMSPIERIEAALIKSFQYVGPELRAQLARLDPIQIARDIAIICLAVAIAQASGVAAAEIDAALLAYAYFIAGWSGLEAAWEFGAASLAAMRARSPRELDAAAHRFAVAFNKLGQAFIAWLLARIAKPGETQTKFKPNSSKGGALEDLEYVSEKPSVRQFAKEPVKETTPPKAGPGISPPEALIKAAKEDQVKWGYAADQWGTKVLKPGDRVYGGIPGQSAYYTDAATLEASQGSREALFKSLQVKEHPEFGYRPMVGEYEVISESEVPFGSAEANSLYGNGGGNQFYIDQYGSKLRLIREIPLGK